MNTSFYRSAWFNRFLLVGSSVLPLWGCAQAQNTGGQNTGVVPGTVNANADDPFSPRASDGLSLWHMNHDPARVRDFLAYLRAQGVDPSDVAAEAAPQNVTRTLIDLASVPAGARGAWRAQGLALVAGAIDGGAPAEFPLHIAKDGTYHLWVQHRAWEDGIAPVALSLYPRGGENLSPLWTDDWSNRAQSPDGQVRHDSYLTWHDTLITLSAGDYTARLTPLAFGWRKRYAPATPYAREVHYLYLTDQLAAPAPSDATLQALRGAQLQGGSIQHDGTAPLSQRDRSTETEWRARPLDWSQAAVQPRLWQLSQAFWRSTISSIATQPISPTANPLDDARQVIFDPNWNLIGTPRDIADKIADLQAKADPSADRGRARQLGWQKAGDLVAWWTGDAVANPLSMEPSATNAWPKAAPKGEPTTRVSLARDSFAAACLQVRNVGDAPLTLRVAAGPLSGANGTFPGRVDARVIAFANRRIDLTSWRPWALLHRPNLTVQSGFPAGVWLDIDARNVPPGDYQARVRWSDASGANQDASGSALLQIHVSSVRVAPRETILMGGYSSPPEGDDYQLDAAQHGFNIGYRPMSKADMNRFGLKLLSFGAQAIINPNTRAQIADFQAQGLTWNDFILSVGDEPSGATPQQLARYTTLATQARQAAPQAQLSFNPRDTATLPTFQLLNPLADWWIPYITHADTNKPQARLEQAIFTQKPWMTYSITAYEDWRPDLPNMIRSQIRSAPARPGDCRGATFYALYVPGHDAWDNQRKDVKDDVALVLPGQYGPVPTIAYQAARVGWQNANLAQMVKEANGPADLVANGDGGALLKWLEARG